MFTLFWITFRRFITTSTRFRIFTISTSIRRITSRRACSLNTWTSIMSTLEIWNFCCCFYWHHMRDHSNFWNRWHLTTTWHWSNLIDIIYINLVFYRINSAFSFCIFNISFHSNRRENVRSLFCRYLTICKHFV